MAATVNQICHEIIEKVNTSKLDFKMNQTPYSLHFSIRKKFSKVPAVTSPHSSNIQRAFEEINQNEGLQKELLNMREEYRKLFNFYEMEMGLRSNLEQELVNQTNLCSKLKAE